MSRCRAVCHELCHIRKGTSRHRQVELSPLATSKSVVWSFPISDLYHCVVVINVCRQIQKNKVLTKPFAIECDV